MILSIDPGNEYSAYSLLDKNLKPVKFGKVLNHDLLIILEELFLIECITDVAIEMIASYGMAVGKTVFDTCVWIGRFYQLISERSNIKPTFIYRKDEKMCICGNMKAKDSNIRQALIDRFANPDWFYGFKADVWAAYAVGVTYHELKKET